MTVSPLKAQADGSQQRAPVALRCPSDASRIIAVPEPLRSVLAPAEWCVFEWTEYVYDWPEADRLRIGNQWRTPIGDGLFLVTFENQLGLTDLRPYRGTTPLGPPLRVEVLARKFARPEASVSFLRAVLDGLFAQQTTLPFLLAAETARNVRDSLRPPTPLFTLHFFRQYGNMLIRVVQSISARPHRVLHDRPAMVPIHEATEIESETLFSMLESSTAGSKSGWTGTGRVVDRLRPERVWQRLPEETLDTPENRFALMVARRLFMAGDALQRARWFQECSTPDDRDNLRRLQAERRQLVRDRRFGHIGELVTMPAASRVLQRRDGYRELSMLWTRFQRSRQPVFDRLQSAIDLRDIATLYEYWVLFELIEQISQYLSIRPAFRELSLASGDTPGAIPRGLTVRFGGRGVLRYNAGLTGYSGVSLRPDYLWQPANGPAIAFDAKFRMRSNPFLGSVSGVEVDDEAGVTPNDPYFARAKEDDLVKMHAYRDALPDVAAAIVLYPGAESVFLPVAGKAFAISLRDVLSGRLSGVGAIPMLPFSGSE